MDIEYCLGLSIPSCYGEMFVPVIPSLSLFRADLELEQGKKGSNIVMLRLVLK